MEQPKITYEIIKTHIELSDKIKKLSKSGWDKSAFNLK
jgi:hypothetical protein